MDHSYTMTQWQDAPSTETPINADNLNHIEQGIGAIYHDVGVLEASLSTFIIGDLAPTESQGAQGVYTSTHDYSANDLMIIEAKIYKALSAIASGESIVTVPTSGEEVNVTEVSLGDAIVDIVSRNIETPDVAGLTARIGALELQVNNISSVTIPNLHSRMLEMRSHVGMIIQSTVLDTVEKVIAAYGGTTWIQHVGYMLYGASTGVSSNNAAKDGGESTHTLTIDEMPVHSHELGSRSIYANGGLSGALVNYNFGDANDGLTGDAGNGFPHNNMPPYKKVYIWERTA